MKETAHTTPPITIFKLLFEAEKAGISIPKEVNEWWTLETIVDEHLNYEKQCSKLTT